MRRRAVLAAGLALPPAVAAPARAQDFPGRAVTMVVAFPPGGQADVVARPVAAALERRWRQPVPVANRPGAAGEIGNAFVARAAPDGTTLLMALSSLAILPEAARLLGRPPAYELDQLAPIALFTADPTLLVVPAASPWRTLEEFIADAKARPGQISYSSSGNYSALHVPMAMLTTAAGLDMLHVPFQGGGPALTALLGGQVQALASGPGPVAPHLREGRLRALAGWGARRLPDWPEVPTLIERGFPEAEYYIWAGVFAPAGTPPPLREALRAAMAAVAAEPETGRALAAGGNTLDYRDGAAFEEFLRLDSARLIRAVRRIGRVE
ncbi:tripartite tricarboxylate transporter substrate binding protein [Belnapia rosea]|uniref:Tripartite-type tricarboxylate transporter, receptor component TctC n=1 Tax=Belnapia rosea TaxID=938405 RepID=A0A1G6J3C3_9PROT|nr:tripartite tricarboxylate transporter substrate binding protein [Belnapia rosea]SDC13298.1 Tripartite-type tricarboxylate transporter, receptor component TctC [Belnapia rosea]